jgi:DNA-binding NarL/FixJ family response regulator
MLNNREERRSLKKITVLIVDDHPLFREGLQRALELEDDVVIAGHCEDGEMALRLTRQYQPDVILLDVNLPTMNGLQVARQLKAERAGVAVVLLTAYHEVGQVIHAMRAGASAYCAKTITPDDLIAIIRDAAAGYYIIGDDRMDRRSVETWINAHIEAIAGPHVADSDEHFIPLSPREMEILQSVTNGMSNKEIASRLGISQQTVKNHMTSILKKLNVEDRTQAAVMALRYGWVRIENTDFH